MRWEENTVCIVNAFPGARLTRGLDRCTCTWGVGVYHLLGVLRIPGYHMLLIKHGRVA